MEVEAPKMPSVEAAQAALTTQIPKGATAGAALVQRVPTAAAALGQRAAAMEREVEVKALSIVVEVKAPKMPSVELEVKVKVKAASIETEVKAPSTTSSKLQAPKMTSVECEVEVKAPKMSSVKMPSAVVKLIDTHVTGATDDVNANELQAIKAKSQHQAWLAAYGIHADIAPPQSQAVSMDCEVSLEVKIHSMEIEIKAPKMSSVQVEVSSIFQQTAHTSPTKLLSTDELIHRLLHNTDAEISSVDMKMPSVECEVSFDMKAPSIDIEVKAPEIPSVECEMSFDMNAPSIEIEVKRQ